VSVVEVLQWMRGHKASTAGLVLVVAGCLALASLSKRVHHLKPRAAATLSVATPASGAGDADATPAPSAQAAQAGAGRGARSARMRGEFESAARYVDFIQSAPSRPQEGGKFYALLAWKRCNELARHQGIVVATAGSDAFHDRAVARVQEMEGRCTGVLATWPGIDALYGIVVEQRGGRDALLPAAGRGLVAPAGRATADADLDAALSTGDRWAAAEALQDNAGWLDVGNPSGDEGVDRRLREWGAEIVACELTGTCRGGVEASLHCLGSGDCAHDDYRDVVTARVTDAQRIVFDTVLVALRQRVGLVAGDTDADKP
jgi:hypothetical protein